MGPKLTKSKINEEIELNNISRTTRSRSIVDQQEDFEESVLVWLDLSLKNVDRWQEELTSAKEIVNNLKTFDQLTECCDYLKSVVDSKIFFIISQNFIPLICSMKLQIRCLTSIYVYGNTNLTKLKQTQLELWAGQNDAVVSGSYTNVTDCFPHLSKDIEDICDHDSIPMTFFDLSTKNFNSKETSSFVIFYQFIRTILFDLPSDNDSQRIFRSCLFYYRDNEKRLEEIEHFRDHYDSRLAIDWYFRTKFLARLLNKAIRSQNLALLFDVRFIFRDIQQLINDRLAARDNEISLAIFYRAQNLSADDLDRLKRNINSIVSFNRYLDLSRTAEEAIKEVPSTSKTFETVLYHFSIHRPTIPITENHILLPVASLFRLRHVQMEADGIWHVHLEFYSPTDLDEKIKRHFDEFEEIPHPFLSVGLVYEKIRQTNKADRFYRFLIQNLPDGHDQTALMCNYIGSICRFKCQFTSALTYHNKALAIYQELQRRNSSSCELIDRTYAQIALVYRDMGDISSAIQYFKLASKSPNEQVDNHLGEIYRNLGRFQMSKEFYERSMVENNLALCYIYQRSFPEALSHLQRQAGATSYINLGVYHQLRKEYDTALTYFHAALEAVKDNPMDTAMIHSYLGLLHCDRRQWALSLKHYEEALEIYKRLLVNNNHPTIALIHDGLGTLYLTKGEYRAAQREFERCLELQTRILPSQHPDIAGTYNNLGGVFNEMGYYEQALLHHYQALAIATSTLPIDHLDIRLYEHNITETKRKLA